MLVWMDGKGPNEIDDFDIDWSTRLAGDTLTSSSWSIVGTDGAQQAPLTLQIASNPAPAYTPTLTKVWLTGGTLDFTYILRNTVTTALGLVLTEEAELPIRNR